MAKPKKTTGLQKTISTKNSISAPLVVKMSSHKAPVFVEKSGKDWLYYGKNDEYPQYLLELYYKCSKHNAIVQGKCKYIAGNGWGEVGDTVVNSDKETLDSITKKITLDKEIYGGFAMEVNWTRGGNKAEFKHVDFSKVRTTIEEDVYFYTKFWRNQYGKRIHDPKLNEDWTEYEPFNPDKPSGLQLIYFRDYTPGLDIYPLPSYEASLSYIELEFQIANYWNNRVTNGFKASAILNFYMGQPTDDEMAKLEEAIKAKFTATDDAGSFILNFAPNKESAADVQQLTPPELGQEYEALNKTLQTEIMSGHGVTSPELFGIMQASNLGRSQLVEQNELFQSRYATPKQRELETFFDDNVFPYLAVEKGKEKYELMKQDPIQEGFTETVIVEHLPKKAIEDIVAKRMGISLDDYPGFDEEKANKVEEAVPEGEEKSMIDHLKKTGKKYKGKIVFERGVTEAMAQDMEFSESEAMSFAKKDTEGGGSGGTGSTGAASLLPDSVIKVVYRYDWIAPFSGGIKATSRNFCTMTLLASLAGKRWTREEINGLSNFSSDYQPDAMTSNVWLSRGGWYNKNGTNVPSCRHQWVQEVIIETK